MIKIVRMMNGRVMAVALFITACARDTRRWMAAIVRALRIFCLIFCVVLWRFR